jgi:hypothetical protein
VGKNPIGLTNLLTNNQGGCHVTAKRRSIQRESFIENWEFYLRFPKFFTHRELEYDSTGEEGKYCFLCWENGLRIPTKEPKLVKSGIEGKMSVNLQIKMWSESMWDHNLQCPLLFPSELREYCKGMPEWVYNSTIEQTKRRVLNDVGFIPTWLKSTEKFKSSV